MESSLCSENTEIYEYYSRILHEGNHIYIIYIIYIYHVVLLYSLLYYVHILLYYMYKVKSHHHKPDASHSGFPFVQSTFPQPTACIQTAPEGSVTDLVLVFLAYFYRLTKPTYDRGFYILKFENS